MPRIVTLLASLLLLCGIAAMAEAAPARGECAPIPALSRLLGPSLTAAIRVDCTGGDKLKPADFGPAWKTVAKRGGYEVDILRRALPRLVSTADAGETTKKWLEVVSPILSTPPCATLLTRLRDSKTGNKEAGCGGDWPEIKLAPQGRARTEAEGSLVVIEAPAGREVTVLSSLGRHRTWSSRPSGGNALVLAVVPQRSTTTIIFSGGNRPRHAAVVHPEKSVAEEVVTDPNGSVELRVYGKTSAPVSVIIDGEIAADADNVAAGQYDATAAIVQGTGSHFITVADAATGMPLAVDELSPTDVAHQSGASREIDLSGEGIVALLRADMDDSCVRAGLDMGAVESATSATIRSFLGNEHYKDVRDDVVAIEVTGGIDRALSRQTSGDPTADGAPQRANAADVSGVVRSVSDLLNGRGYGAGLILHVSCSASATQPSFTFAFSRINTRQAWYALVSRRYENFIDRESETVERREDLLNGLRTPLLRLFTQPSVRFVVPPGHRFYDSHATVAVAVSLPEKPTRQTDYEVEVAIAEMETQAASASCRGIDQAARLTTSGLPLGDSVAGNHRGANWKKPGKREGCLLSSEEAVSCAPLEVDRQTQELSLDLLPQVPGEYLVEVRLRRAGRTEPVARARRCAHIEGADARWIAQAYFGFEPATGDGAFMAGGWLFSESSGERVDAELGAFAGYGFLTHGLPRPPDWRDLARTPDALRDGMLDVEWVRHAVLVGPSIRLGVPLWSTAAPHGDARRFRLVAQAAPLLDLGFIDVGDVPKQLRELRTTTSDVAFEVDGSLLAQLALRLRYNDVAEFHGGAWVGWFGIDDIVGQDSVGVAKDSRVYVGFTAGWGYEL